jgi:hypothetical protein
MGKGTNEKSVEISRWEKDEGQIVYWIELATFELKNSSGDILSLIVDH